MNQKSKPYSSWSHKGVFNMKNLRVILSIYMLASFISACTPIEDKAFSFALQEIRKTLKDPDSAKFNDVFMTKIESNKDGSGLLSVCGYVNAKNSLGGYAGAKRFVTVVHIRADHTFGALDAVLDENSSFGPIVGTFQDGYWNTYCNLESSMKKI